MAKDLILTGGCLCGAVRYEAKDPIEDAVHCHCTMCRRASGSVVVTWFSVPLGNFRYVRGKPDLYRSSSHGERRFCSRCGAQLTFHTVHEPNLIEVTVGTLDHPEDVRPDRHIWTSTRVHWLKLDEHLPSHAEFTPLDDAMSGS